MNRKVTKTAGVALVLIMLLSLILSIGPASQKVGEWVGVSGDVLKFWARTVFVTALGLYLISTGVAALAVPVVGIALIVIGLALVAYAWWPFFSSKGKSE